MNHLSITTLKPNVTQREALRSFSGGGLSSWYWRMRRGPLRRIADVYVPFFVYTVRYRMNTGECRRIFALDAVNGSLDLFQFPEPPGASKLASVISRNVLAASLPEVRAEDLLRQKVLRLIFQQGFFKVRDPQLQIQREAALLYIPYWLGFYSNGVARCRVLDAVRRRFEGAKASAFFEQWLAA
jgi:hypothetical protein